MDFRELKRQTDNIEMSDEMKTRIIMRCRAHYAAERERNMKKHNFKKPAFALVAVAICLCLAVGVGAAAGGGMFSDVKNWSGAVTGTEYLNASEEIAVAAEKAGDELKISAVFVKPDAAPYAYFEEMSIEAYSIVDESGKTVVSGEGAAVSVADGEAVFYVPAAELTAGNYSLVIESFIGGSKADQPLPVKGDWEVDFTA